MSGVLLAEAYRDAGLPDGVFNLVMGPGETVGQEIQENPGIDGIVFTGSYEVGMGLFRTFSKRWPKPCIVEMGGKNPAIVTARADLEEAAEGIMRSAFGFGGQKCSANSRVYVERPVHDELVKLLVQKTEKITIGDPLLRTNWLGPIIDGPPSPATRRPSPRRAATGASSSAASGSPTTGWTAASTSSRPSSSCRPTTASSRTSCSCPSRRSARSTRSTRRCALSNDNIYGLTAGVYSEDPAEVERFLDEIHAGVLYVNRRAGATTGAWPGVQPFGGWKGSGSTGKSGLGMYYPAQFLREQSHTIVD